MDTATKEMLKEHFTPESPLGPISSDHIYDPDVMKYLFNTENRIYSDVLNKPSIIVGRRGAGKTAFLRSVKLDGKYQVIAEIKTHEAFRYVATTIQRLSREIHFIESIAEVWEAVIWGAIFLELVRILDNEDADKIVISKYLKHIGLKKEGDSDDLIKLVVDALTANGRITWAFIASILFKKLTDTPTFAQTKETAERILESKKMTAMVLIDSMEDFSLEQADVSRALSGLLKCIGSFRDRNKWAAARFCIPSELWYPFSDLSSNPLKDFKNRILIHWHAGELLVIAANKLAIYLEIHEAEFYHQNRIANLNLENRDDCQRLFKLIMPDFVVNGLGKEEEPIAYILRHTQLLPRQLFTIINSIVQKNNSLGGCLTNLTEQAVKEGVYESEKELTDEIFTAYRFSYPQAKNVCEKSIPYLPFTFSVGHLHHIFNHHGKKASGYQEFSDYLRLFLEIGAVGRVMPDGKMDRYIIGEFEYTLPHKLVTSTDDVLCLHPSFCQVFRAIYPVEDKRVIYPYGSAANGEDHRSSFQ